MQIVISQLNRAAFLVVLASVLLPSVRAQDQCVPEAITVAQKFVHAQFQGASIGGSQEAFKEALTLLIDDGEPPASPIVFVASYKIQDSAMIGNECRVAIIYERLGTISPETLIFTPAKTKEEVHIWLARDSGTWKVHMNAKQYGLPAHAGIEAIKNWLHVFLQPPIDAKTAKARHLLATIDKYQ